MIICYRVNITLDRVYARLLERSQLAIRGALGYSLKDVNGELFKYVFKPRRSMFRGFALRKLSGMPKPLVVSPLYKEDNNYYFKVRIFGKAVYYKTDILNALIALERRLLYDSKIRVNYIDIINELGNKVVNVYDGKINYYDIEEYIIKDTDIRAYAESLVGNINNSILRLAVDFITPVLIIRNGENVIKDNTLNLADIVVYAARRRSLLSYLYLNNRMYYTPEFITHLKEWCYNNSSILTQRFTPSGISIKGKRVFYKGNIVFNINNDKNKVIDIIDLLKFSEFVGIGKSSAFGMGQYKISIT